MLSDGNGNDSYPVLGDEFLAQAERELKRLLATLHDLDEELAALQRRRNEVNDKVVHLQGLQGPLRLGNERDTSLSNSDTRPKSRRESDADLVVEYLGEIGEPLHYTKIYEGLHKRGLQVAGDNPANTLLSRYFNDPRLDRVKRGTYALKS